MSEMSVKARAAAKEKVKRLTSADPHQRVDSSTWSPPEAMDYHQQTGLRPIGRQERKRGGKVEGKAAHHHAGKKSRVHRDMGGPLASPISQGMGGQGRMAFGYPNARSPMQAATGMKHGGEAHKDEHEDRALVERMVRKRALTGKSHGGEIHHADCRCERCNGGAMANGGRAKRAFGGGDGAVDDHWIAGATKNKGALHRKLHVPEGEKIPAKKLAKAEHSRNPTERREANLARTLKRMNHANGGAAPANEWKPHREDDGDSPPQYEPRERTYREHHARGGKASGKGKMNVNIIIAPKDGGGAQPMAGPPGGQPPIPPPPRAPMMPPGMMGGAPPMPGGPAPMGMPPGLASGMPLGGPGQLQMPRNRGGRAYPIDTGSGGAEARLEKIKAYGTKNPCSKEGVR